MKNIAFTTNFCLEKPTNLEASIAKSKFVKTFKTSQLSSLQFFPSYITSYLLTNKCLSEKDYLEKLTHFAVNYHINNDNILQQKIAIIGSPHSFVYNRQTSMIIMKICFQFSEMRTRMNNPYCVIPHRKKSKFQRRNITGRKSDGLWLRFSSLPTWQEVGSLRCLWHSNNQV